MITQAQIEAVKDKIVKEFDPEKIVLFGSYAYGEPNESSDLDLLVVNGSSIENKVITKNIRQVFLKRNFAMDLLVCNPAQIEEAKKENLSLINQITSKGKVLYEKEYKYS